MFGNKSEEPASEREREKVKTGNSLRIKCAAENPPRFRFFLSTNIIVIHKINQNRTMQTVVYRERYDIHWKIWQRIFLRCGMGPIIISLCRCLHFQEKYKWLKCTFLPLFNSHHSAVKRKKIKFYAFRHRKYTLVSLHSFSFTSTAVWTSGVCALEY